MLVTVTFYSLTDSEDICTVERLFSSSLVAIVSLSSPRKLKVCHFKKGTEICNYSYSNTILAVRLNRLVSVDLDFLFIYLIPGWGRVHGKVFEYKYESIVFYEYKYEYLFYQCTQVRVHFKVLEDRYEYIFNHIYSNITTNS